MTLPVAIIRAPDRLHLASPVVFVDGGPSYNEIDAFTAGYLARMPFAARRDIVLYNQRGVGYAQPGLGCPEFDGVRAEAFSTDPLYIGRSIGMFLAADTACRDRLAQSGIDLTMYTTEADAADLNDLRMALGYTQWNIFGLSAGGVIVLTEMRLFPGGIRSAALDSPVGNRWQQRGSDNVRASNRMYDKMFAGCAADPECNRLHPDLRARFYARVGYLRAHPVVVQVPLQGGRTFPLTVNGDLLLNLPICADPVCAAGQPQLLELAARGEIARFLAALFGGPLTPNPPVNGFFSEGKTAVVHCHDYIAFEPDSELRSLAEDLPEWRGTLLSLRFVFVPTQTKQACLRWRVGSADPPQHQPVRSNVPSLVLTGEWDGIIAPPLQHVVGSYLENAFQFQFPGIGHAVIFWSACPGHMLTEFLDAPWQRPDASCMASMPEVSFDPPPAATNNSAVAYPGSRPEAA